MSIILMFFVSFSLISGCDFFRQEDFINDEAEENNNELDEKNEDKENDKDDKNDLNNEENNNEADETKGSPWAHENIPISEEPKIFTMENDFKIGDIEVNEFFEDHAPISEYLEEEPEVEEEQPTEYDTFIEVRFDGLTLNYNIDVFQEGKGLTSVHVTGENYSVSRDISPGDDIQEVLKKFPNKEEDTHLLYQDEETQTRGEISTRADNSIERVTLVHQESIDHLPTSMQIYVNEKGLVDEIELFFEI